ncbi:MAG: hypothetical protein K1X64_02845 [Myxococcaceae bacterium]|nr:hypothetical protein [Myxococcaceae bacterium]
MSLRLWLPLLVVTTTACMCGREPPTSTQLKKEGEECFGDDTCETGLCEPLPGKPALCVRKCTAGCKDDEVCTQLTPERFACAPERGGLCVACAKDSDCPYPADKCIVINGEGACGRDCTFDGRCPVSYKCLNGLGVDSLAKKQQCVPSSGSCQCTFETKGQTISCTVENGFGKCSGMRTCDGVMGYGACDAKTPTGETCNGIDDDCDGTVDEDQPMTSCGVGACQRTVSACMSGSVMACTPGTPVAEICNSIDDDCDGRTDEDFNLVTNVHHCGECNHECMLDHASPKCAMSQCEVDTCEMNWGNCNLQHPDGCETNLLTNADHCGACNNTCSFPNAAGRCDMGMCKFTCLPGFIDLDMNPTNGCEYECTPTSATDVPDVNFVDANCDGIDGELGNGIFVAVPFAGGSDANPGTRELPKATINAALAQAKADGKRDVYVSAGAYVGTLEAVDVDGKYIAGGYAPMTFKRSLLNTTQVINGNPGLKVENANNNVFQFITLLGNNASGFGETAYGAWVKGSNGVRFEGLTVLAGNGGDGITGQNGLGGTPGGDGAPGVTGCTDDPDWNVGFPIPDICNECARPAASFGGASACGNRGGSGGRPGWNGGNNGESGAAGSGAMGANGGGGVGGKLAGGPISPSADGLAGADGMNGIDGLGADGIGTLTANGYQAALATAGQSGGNGVGGGGGGGGGGGCASNLLGVLCVCKSWGSVGGAGGGGGCGGVGGFVGMSGGASIGVFLWDAQVTAVSTSVTSGKGGKGGDAGSGGPGGDGGKGEASGYDEGQQGDSSRGGAGGKGGKGGKGGSGGAGGGGPSIGVAKNAGAAWNPMNVSYTSGVAGSGGTSPAGGAANGRNGQQAQVQNF